MVKNSNDPTRSNNQSEVGKLRSVSSVDSNAIGVRSPRQRCRVVSPVDTVSLTKQADASRANIHSILDKYKKTGHLPMRVAQPLEGDIPAVESFHQAMNIVASAHQAFDALPVHIRQQFEYKPEKLLAFVLDDKNYDEAKKMGLVAPKTVTDSIKVSVVSPPTPPAPSAPKTLGEGAGGETA